MGNVLGIDLGTSNSAAAVPIDGKLVVIPSSEGTTRVRKAFPSVVAFKAGEVLVGEAATGQMDSNPEGTISAVKRKMGSDFKIKVFDKEYTPQQIASFILRKIRQDAEKFLGEKVEEAIITAPTHFNDKQRQAIIQAGEMAGLQVVEIVDEPVAASIAYSMDKVQEHTVFLVFDFGAEELDITVMEKRKDGDIQVKSVANDTQLGGTDMDNVLVNYLIGEFKTQSGIDVREDTPKVMRIKRAAEKTRIELSRVSITDVNLPFLAIDPLGNIKNFELTITRAKLEELVMPIIEKCRKPLMRALTDANIILSDINKIILVGGTTNMPIVQEFLIKIFGKEPERSIDPMEVVAIGAAIEGAKIAKSSLQAPTPMSDTLKLKEAAIAESPPTLTPTSKLTPLSELEIKPVMSIKPIKSEKQAKTPESEPVSDTLKYKGPLARSLSRSSNKNMNETEKTRSEQSFSEASSAVNDSRNDYHYSEGSRKAQGTNLKIVFPIIGAVAATFVIVLASLGFLDPQTPTDLATTEPATPMQPQLMPTRMNDIFSNSFKDEENEIEMYIYGNWRASNTLGPTKDCSFEVVRFQNSTLDGLKPTNLFICTYDLSEETSIEDVFLNRRNSLRDTNQIIRDSRPGSNYEIRWTNDTLRSVELGTIADNKLYTLAYNSDPKNFEDNCNVAQKMVDSFKITTLDDSHPVGTLVCNY